MLSLEPLAASQISCVLESIWISTHIYNPTGSVWMAFLSISYVTRVDMLSVSILADGSPGMVTVARVGFRPSLDLLILRGIFLSQTRKSRRETMWA